MDLAFRGELWFWKGPAPWHFVTVPEEQSVEIAARAESVTYGWGMIPVTARIGGTEWTTSLWPKDDLYVLPIKTSVRKAEQLELDDVVDVRLSFGGRIRPSRTVQRLHSSGRLRRRPGRHPHRRDPPRIEPGPGQR